MPDKYFERLKEHYPKSEDRKESQFNHFSDQARFAQSQSELEKNLNETLKGIPEAEKIKKIASLVAKSYLSKYSKEDLRSGFGSFNTAIGLIPQRDLMYVYRLIPKEKRYAYLDECVAELAIAGVVDSNNESQVRGIKSRLLLNMTVAQGSS